MVGIPTTATEDTIRAARRRRRLRRALGTAQTLGWICFSLVLTTVALAGLLTLR
jgi:hypothetical protein